MIKLFYLLAALLFSPVIYGQSYESIKAKAILQQYRQAKDDIDKAMQNDRFNAKPEAYLLKATIYSGLANDVLVKGTPEENSLLNEAETAFTRYSQLDPDLILLIDPTYQNSIINFYTWFYTKGYKDYEAGQWQLCYEKLKKAVAFSDILIAKKIISTSLDTNVLILAGIAAESSGNKEEAVKYYGRLADNKVTGDGFESVYRFLVSHYFAKKDMASFEKYKALGEQLFPKSEYFKYDKIDFAIGLEESFDAKVKALEEVLVTDANNYKANQIMGEIIYDTLNSTSEGAVSPANAADLEKKMITAFTKSAAAKPGSEIPFIYMGDHFINKAVKVTAAREAHAADMKTRTKPGTMASKEDIAKRDLLDKQYGEALEGARDPYEKAAAIFAAKPKSEDKNQALRDKQQYRKVASYLADVYTYKKIQAKSKPADQAKYAAEEKKWNDLYDSIK